MRIARWTVDGQVADGFILEKAGRDVVVEFPDDLTVSDVLRGGLKLAHLLHAAAESSSGTSLAEVRLIAPVVPAAIRDFVAFEEHVEGVSAAVDGKSEVVPEWYEAPTFYFTNPHTVLGPDEEVSPPDTARLDFELEIAVIVGGDGGTSLTPAEASSSIFGYTIMNDWSARDIQSREMKVRLGPAKGKDFGLTLGPWIVTADELDQYLDQDGFLAIHAEVAVNGALVGEDLVSNMGWTFPELVAYASRNSRVVSGDVLGSGTVGNGGCLAELWGRSGALVPPPLTEGDVVTMVVEGIGALSARVGRSPSVPELSVARPRPLPRARTRRRDEVPA